MHNWLLTKRKNVQKTDRKLRWLIPQKSNMHYQGSYNSTVVCRNWGETSNIPTFVVCYMYQYVFVSNWLEPTAAECRATINDCTYDRLLLTVRRLPQIVVSLTELTWTQGLYVWVTNKRGNARSLLYAMQSNTFIVHIWITLHT